MPSSRAQSLRILLLCLLTGTGLHVTPILALPDSDQPSPDITITPNILDFGDISAGIPDTLSVTISNTGKNLFLVSELIFSAPESYRVISPGSSFWIRPDSSLELQIECLPRDTGCSQAAIIMKSTAAEDIIRTRYCATAREGVSGFKSDYTLLFPATIIGNCVQKPLRILNADTTAIRLYGIYADGPDTKYFDLIWGFPDTGLVVHRGTEFSLMFQFCPEEIRSVNTTFRCITDKGIFLIRLAGNGIRSTISPAHYFTLQLAGGHVGAPITTSLQVDPPLTLEDSVTTLRLTVQIPPGSLLLMNARPVNSLYTLDITEQNHRTGVYHLKLTYPEGQIIGEDLLSLEFIGLSSGQPENRIELRGEIWKGNQNQDSRAEFLGGTILLEGCTVGASGFSRRIQIEAIRIDPAGGNARIFYTAPEGAEGTFSVIDASGQIIHRDQTVGNGMPQEMQIPLESLPSGLYGLQARFAADAVIVPFMHSR